MTPDLLIPLDWLPGPLPVGAPVRPSTGMYSTTGTPVFLCDPPAGVLLEAHVASREPLHGYYLLRTDSAYWSNRAALDLSPPPLADGYPTRIDGLGVAAAMLARAMRLPGSPAWLELSPSDEAPAGYRVRLRAVQPGRDRIRSAYLDTLAGPLPQVDPADPLAVRRLMVELYRLRVWEVTP